MSRIAPHFRYHPLKALAANDDTFELDYAATMIELAGVARFTNDPSRAKTFCLIALRIYRGFYGDTHVKVAQVYATMCRLAASQSPPLS